MGNIHLDKGLDKSKDKKEAARIYQNKRRLLEKHGVTLGADDVLDKMNAIRKLFLSDLIDDCLDVTATRKKGSVNDADNIARRRQVMGLLRDQIGIINTFADLHENERVRTAREDIQPIRDKENVAQLDDARKALSKLGIGKKLKNV